MKLVDEVNNLLENMSTNPFPDKDSNWYRLAKVFDIGTLDLDKFAYGMGLRNFKNLDISIGPRSLFKRDKKKFIKILKSSSLKAEDMKDQEITKLVEKES